MGEIRIVGPGKTRGYPYPVCKNSLVSIYKIILPYAKCINGNQANSIFF